MSGCSPGAYGQHASHMANVLTSLKLPSTYRTIKLVFPICESPTIPTLIITLLFPLDVPVLGLGVEADASFGFPEV